MTNAMFNQKIIAIESEINARIATTKFEYDRSGRTPYYYQQINQIHGLIAALQILTGKEYYIDGEGLHRRKTQA